MSLILIEGFDLFGDITHVQKKYFANTYGTLALAAGRISGNCLEITSANLTHTPVNFLTTPVFADCSQVILGAAMKIDNYSNTPLLYFSYNSGVQIIVRLLSTGYVVITDADNIVIGTSSVQLFLNLWQYVEVKCDMSTASQYASATVEFKVNGNTTIAGNHSTYTDSRRANHINTISFVISTSSSTTLYVDDIYVIDTLGTDHNNYLGAVQVGSLVPSGSGHACVTPWSLSGAAHDYTAVQEIPSDGDISYLETSTQTAYSLMSFTNNLAFSGISAVQLELCAKKTGPGLATYKPLVFDTVNQGTPVTLTTPDIYPQTDYFYSSNLWTKVPTNNAAWTTANINSIQFGIQRTN